MNIAIRGQNFELNESIKAYTEEKVNRLERFFDSINTADVTLKVERNKSIENNHRVEITLRANSQVIRAEEEVVRTVSHLVQAHRLLMKIVIRVGGEDTHTSANGYQHARQPHLDVPDLNIRILNKTERLLHRIDRPRS